MADCEHIVGCGFFKKYQSTKDMACQGFILLYCKGTKKEVCKRREHRQKTGTPPPDNMSPSGVVLADKV